jgi:ABC-type branched-subunit amino acid transport system substrate-binding protein
MLHAKTKAVAVAAAALVLAAGCGSSKSGGTNATGSTSGSTAAAGSSGSASGKTYTIGLLTDLTGLAASGNKTSQQGVEAGIAWAKTQGYNFKLDTGDTQTSPSAALTAAKKLVDQDHALAIVADSALAFGGAPYFTQKGIPVVGIDQDANEWATSKNMFSVTGVLYTNEVSTVMGQFFKMQGASKVGVLGYSVSPSSSESAKAAAVSAQSAGLKAPYVNGAFPFGSTNVAPVALAMKSANVDGFTASTDPNTSFALVTALRQAGVDLKVPAFADGYGGDLVQAGPSASQVAQNVYFTLGYEPVEMNTPATQQFVHALNSVGVTGDPTFAEYNGYASVVMLVQALKAAGPQVSSSSLMSALSNIHSWDAGGLLGNHPIDINNRAQQVDNCQYFTKYVGSSFQLVPGADPLCGSVIPGKTVTAG